MREVRILTVITDETENVAYIKRLVICMRVVDDQLTIQGEILFYSGPTTGTL